MTEVACRQGPPARGTTHLDSPPILLQLVVPHDFLVPSHKFPPPPRPPTPAPARNHYILVHVRSRGIDSSRAAATNGVYQAAFHSSGFRAGQGLARNVGITSAQVIRHEKDSEREFAIIS